METQIINPALLTNLYAIGIHGIEHSYRVYQLIQKLCDLETISKSERLQLEFCAFFHDIGRINDLVDITHGFKSFEKLEKYNFFGLNNFNNSTVQYIIQNHCIDDKNAISNSKNYKLNKPERAEFLILLFKDADGLDRFRLQDFDEKYLRISRSSNLIDFARKINDETYSHGFISNQIYSWIESIY
ncbi:MAG: HD domain-containing protein [Flavobacteriaceae bacterium]